MLAKLGTGAGLLLLVAGAIVLLRSLGDDETTVERPTPESQVVPRYSQVRRIALAMLGECDKSRTVDRSTSTEDYRELFCTLGGGGDRFRVFTYKRSKTTAGTEVGATNARRYFVHEGVVVLPEGESGDPSVPYLNAAEFTGRLKQKCRCGEIEVPEGLPPG